MQRKEPKLIIDLKTNAVTYYFVFAEYPAYVFTTASFSLSDYRIRDVIF